MPTTVTQEATTMYDADALMAQYNCKGNPEAYRFTLAHFETKACSRCGGGGHYSYCQRYGTLCFGCHGTGFGFTARGLAAYTYYKGLQSKPLASIAPGTRVYDKDNRRCMLAEVKPSTTQPGSFRVGDGPWQQVQYEGQRLDVTYSYKGDQRQTWVGVDGADLVRTRDWTPEQRQAQLAHALAYQALLTKAGTLRKRRPTKAVAV